MKEARHKRLHIVGSIDMKYLEQVNPQTQTADFQKLEVGGTGEKLLNGYKVSLGMMKRDRSGGCTTL